jgi:signal peptidase I
MKQEKIVHQRSPDITLRVVLGKIIITCIFVWAIFTFLFGVGQMKGESMYPRIRDGDLILYYRLEQNYNIGDVVTFQMNGRRCTARIVAMGGEEVDLSTEGELLVNGNVQDEEIFYPTEELPGGITYPYQVDPDTYFVLCDYRTTGVDSRSYGSIPKDEIDGKVITILRRRGI